MDGGFCRSLQPARWGGGEVSLVEFADAMMELCACRRRRDGSPASSVHPWQLALFPKRRSADVRRGPDYDALLAYNPTGHAGRLPAATSCGVDGRSRRDTITRALSCSVRPPAWARWAVFSRDFRSFLLFGDQYRIDDNWHVAGLEGTGSKDIVVEPVFVPDYRTQSHLDYGMNLPMPGQKLNDGPLYRLPWSVVFHVAVASSVLGSARGFIETWTSLSRSRTMSLGGRAADDVLMQQHLAEALWYLDATVTRMRADAIELWQMAEAHEPATMEHRARVRWNMNRGCELVGQAVTDLFRNATGRSIFLDHPLQRRFQDVQAALSHAFMSPDPLARAVGGALLGTSKPEVVL